MVSTRTIYIRKKQDLVDKILLATIKLARMNGARLQKVPMPTLKLILMLVENPFNSMGKSKLNRISQSGRKGSILYYGKQFNRNLGKGENDDNSFTSKGVKKPNEPAHLTEP